MALEITAGREVTGPPIVSTRRLWLTAERDRVVEDGDEAATFLLVGEGGELSAADAARYGVTDGPAPPVADKPKRARK
jgi:hypothetical protein